MSVWAQIGTNRVTSIPPDGSTAVTLYASFDFAGSPVPEGTVVRFLVGKGSLPQSEEGNVPFLDEDAVLSSITPIEGIELEAATGVVEGRTIANPDGSLSVVASAVVNIKPVADAVTDEVSIIAYSTFDRLGTVDRLTASEASLTILSGEGIFLAAAERYDISGNAWSTITSMNEGRAGLFMEASTGSLYAIGGFNGNFTGTNERYDITSDAWETRSPLPVARGYGASVEHAGDIYIIGGFNFQVGGATTNVDRYDPDTDTWLALAPLPYPVAFATAEVIGSKIYVMYGASRLSNVADGSPQTIQQFNLGVLEYDVVGDSWSILDVDHALSLSPVTTLSAASAGDRTIIVPSTSAIGSYGVITIDRGGAGQETLRYTGFDSKTGILILDGTLSSAHAAGTTVHLVSLPETRLSPFSRVLGTKMQAFGGLSYAGLTSAAASNIRGAVSEFDTSVVPPSDNFAQTSVTENLPRYRGSAAIDSGTLFMVGGSAKKSDWLDEVETFDGSTFSGPSGFDEMLNPRHSLGVAASGGFVYAVGGAGSGHAPGWLKIDVEVDPREIRADGKTTAGVSITATDVSGDPPPDGTRFKVRGLIYAKLSESDRAELIESGETTASHPPQQKISILPILFSGTELTSMSGVAATTMFPRSEDVVNEIERLLEFVQANEAVPTQEQLKESFSGDNSQKTMKVGEQRQLYQVAIEVSVDDDFFFGTSDSDAAILDQAVSGLAQSDFSFNPPAAQQGLSATASYFSDITSIPDVQLVTEEPVAASEAKEELEDIRLEEIPFGASPHYDALVNGIRARNEDTTTPVPQNVLVSASDNDPNSSANGPTDVVEESRSASETFPVFVTSFVVTDPVSLSARRSRTDVADLELISSRTGGNSFSIVDSSFVPFVIDRIKTSAPESIGSGTILVSHEINGSVASLFFEVDLKGDPGNSAEVRFFHSRDNYTFEELETIVPVNELFVLSTPVAANYVRYLVILRSESFDSPALTSATINVIEPNVKYLFTLPQTVSGQVSEMAAVVNHRLPPGGVARVGLSHGEGVVFERDYESRAQPSLEDRGTIVAVNRSFEALVGDDSTADVLDTRDFFVYSSRSGPWPQDAVARVFLNNQEAAGTDFILVPEDGLVVFRKRLSASDVVSMEVALPSEFRVGLKIVNPSANQGLLDSFAYSWGVTQDDPSLRPNRPPRALNPFVGSPVLPGGPLVANYTFSDPDGDEEDEEQTVVTWFRNGVLIPELRNKRTVTNSDLLATRPDARQLIVSGQEWFFSVRPSDGRAFGQLAISPVVTVANVPPGASNVRIASSNPDPLIFSSVDTLTAEFDFTDEDGDDEDGTVFTWFVNGIEAKTGPDGTLAPTEVDAGGNKLLSPGNTVRVDVVASDGTDFGNVASSPAITITSAPPTVSGVAISPATPSAASSLVLSFSFSSPDDLDDRSVIAWFRNGERVSELDNLRRVPSSLLTPGNQWFAVVTPSDGSTEGVAVKSNVVAIKF